MAKKLKCKHTGEVFIVGQEHFDGDIYVYRAMSMFGYLSEVREIDYAEFKRQLELTEEVELEEYEGSVE